MDSLIYLIKNIAIISIILLVSFVVALNLLKIYVNYSKKKVKKNDKFIRDYFNKYKNSKVQVLDDTPLPIYIGKRYYLIKPLTYRQYTRICRMYALVLEKLIKSGIDLTDADQNIGKITDVCEDEFFKVLAVILFFSRNKNIDNEDTISMGIEDEFRYLKNNATLDEITRLLQIVSIQNDIEQSFAAFGGVFNVKKKIQ